ncbi:DMT family transporter [Paenibacillus arenosi]|uniref:EamA family transporter n=1 Tax=Paenibacillus arenosi TaxID=2774142 RepID=A0ABR9AVJ0_9BACL|nr:EamA family transporter [Paenibacillus arenosi]MBD8497225.1 EamA family transporter [Paenibacillus arenosi]
MDTHALADQRSTFSSKGVWLVALGAAFWGLGPLFRVLVLEYLTSTQIVLLEHLVLLVFAAPIVWKHRAELKGANWKHWGALLFISWGGSVIATIMFTEAFATGNANTVLLLQKLQPLFAVILARFLLKEQLPKRFGYLLVVALIGTYLLTFGWSLPQGVMSEVVGISSLLALGAALLWGGSTVMGRYMLDKMQYETVTALRFLLALPLLFVFTWSENASWSVPPEQYGSITFYIILQAVLLGLFSILLYYRGLSETKASYATLAELSFPLVGMMMNWIVFNQMVTFAQLTGFVLIWIALFYVSRQQ